MLCGAATKSGCTGSPAGWRHDSSVTGAKVGFHSLGSTKSRLVSATAGEDAAYRAGILRVPGSKPLGSAARKRLAALLAKAPTSRFALTARGKVRAYRSTTIHFSRKSLKAGCFVAAFRLAAAMNPGRSTLFVSRPFRIGPAVHAKPKPKAKPKHKKKRK